MADCRAAARAFAASGTSSLFQFRDAFRPNSEEAAKPKYKLLTWGEQERELVLGRLRDVAEQAPGLLRRAAADGPLSLYRAKLRGFSQAKGAYRRLAFDRAAFPSPGYDWLTRIIAHELVHAGDPYSKISTDPGWNALMEPRIAALRVARERGPDGHKGRVHASVSSANEA